MFARRKKNDGMALVLVLIAAIVILGAMAIIISRVQSVKANTDYAVAEAKLGEACQAGIDLAIERVWNQYVIGNGNTTGNLASYRVFMQDLVPNNEDLNCNGMQDEDEFDRNGNGEFEINDPLVIITEDNPRELDGGALLTNVSLSRCDDLSGTDIRITCTAFLNGHSRTMTQSVRVGGELFSGFEYAVLANNINCILCHAQFLPLDMALNSDSENYGTFDRIKIASLESLLVRPTEAHSGVAGSVYTRGRVYKQNGGDLSASALARSTFHSYDFSTDNGKLMQDESGELNSTGFHDAELTDEEVLEQFANLYMDYPTESADMTDGDLPESFPAPFPDENNNRVVDDEEFEAVMNSANGSISFELDPGEAGGSITGGVAYGVPSGATYDGGNTLPTASNGALSSLSTNGFYDGNLILVGTENDPIVIEDQVAVNGDLIIKGPVKGWGQLLVRGNTYVIGDVTYADAPGEFGVAEDGTENGFALSSGGSVIMGDYLTIRAKNNNGDYGTWQGKFIDMREEHKTVTCRDESTTDVGYFDEGVVDAGWANGDEGMFSFTTSELMLFNRMEHLKAEADPSYTPRYYRLRPTQPIYEYVGTDEHAISYFDPNVEIIGDTSGAVFHNINPTDYWMSEEQMRNFWWQDEMSRTSREPFRFDGLLYCNNSIFCITRSKGRHNSNTYGQMIIRGGVVTADLGMFIPGKDFSVPRDGLKLYYDKRVNRFLRVEDTSQVEFHRVVCRLARLNDTD